MADVVQLTAAATQLTAPIGSIVVTADDSLDGNSANHQAPPCNVKRGLIDETPSAIQYSNDGFSNHNRESWYHLKKNVESFYDWKINDETTLFCLHEINHSVPIKAICQMSETSQGRVQRIALALLSFYQKQPIDILRACKMRGQLFCEHGRYTIR